MADPQYPDDRSRNGYLVHDARSSGRELTITAYLEGGHNPIKSKVMCRTPEQAFAMATLLMDAQLTDG